MTTRLERNIERVARTLNVEFEVVKEGYGGFQMITWLSSVQDTEAASEHTRNNGNTR